MIALLLSVAFADPCADPATELAAAQLAFEDAEVEQARDRAAAAEDALACASSFTTEAFLRDLYGFQAVVAYALADSAGTTGALQRLYTAFPNADFHPLFGPELEDQASAWRARLGGADVPVLLVEGSEARVDGRPLSGGEAVQVVSGRHLIQADTSLGIRGEWLQVRGPVGLRVGESIEVGPVPTPATTQMTRPELSGVSAVDTPPPPPPATPERARRHRTGLLITGLITAAAGGGALTYGFLSEQSFHDDPYSATSYAGCALGDACYGDARVDAIQSDATRIRVAYLAGYGLTALGVGIVGTELFILPAPRATGGQIGLKGSF